MKIPSIFPLICAILICTMISGCRENAGTWGEDKVKAKIVEKLELTGAQLTPSDNGFTGEGPRTDGETVTFTITQDPESGRMS